MTFRSVLECGTLCKRHPCCSAFAWDPDSSSSGCATSRRTSKGPADGKLIQVFVLYQEEEDGEVKSLVLLQSKTGPAHHDKLEDDWAAVAVKLCSVEVDDEACCCLTPYLDNGEADAFDTDKVDGFDGTELGSCDSFAHR